MQLGPARRLVVLSNMALKKQVLCWEKTMLSVGRALFEGQVPLKQGVSTMLLTRCEMLGLGAGGLDLQVGAAPAFLHVTNGQCFPLQIKAEHAAEPPAPLP